MIRINQNPIAPAILEKLMRYPDKNNQSKIVQSTVTNAITTPASQPKLPWKILGIIFEYSTLSNQSPSPEEIKKNMQQLISLMLVIRSALAEVNVILTSASNQRSHWISQQMNFCYKNIRVCMARESLLSAPAHYWVNKILDMVQHIWVSINLSQAFIPWFDRGRIQDNPRVFLDVLNALSVKRNIKTLHLHVSFCEGAEYDDPFEKDLDKNDRDIICIGNKISRNAWNYGD